MPADVRLISTTAFHVGEAALTGESVPVEKDAAALLDPAAPLAERRNMAYLGTLVSAGKASAIVAATGMQTELRPHSRAPSTDQESEEPTPLPAATLAQMGKVLVYLCLAIVAIIFSLQVLRGGNKIQEAFLLAVSLAVAAVPEGLPAVVTIALALGLQRMVKRHALIRKLPSVGNARQGRHRDSARTRPAR